MSIDAVLKVGAIGALVFYFVLVCTHLVRACRKFTEFKYPPPPPPPGAEWRSLKAYELVKDCLYRDPVAKVMVRVTKPAIAGSCSALENTARGMYWSTVTQCYQAMDIRDDQLEERVEVPERPELPEREPDRIR